MLLEVKAEPGTAPGHILCLAAFGHAQRRTEEWRGAGQLIRWYAGFKGIGEDKLREDINGYLKRCGNPYWEADEAVEVLSR